MLKIRLMRIGAKKRPFYRVVLVDERAKRTGGYLELLGTYNPLTEPKDIKLATDRIDHWIKQGAQMSTGFLRIVGKAPQRPPRKPKKEEKESPAISSQPAEGQENQQGPEQSEQPEKSETPENSENQSNGEPEVTDKPEDQNSEEAQTPETSPEQTEDSENAELSK